MIVRAATFVAAMAIAAAAVGQTVPPAPAAPQSFWTSGFNQGISEYQTGTFDQPVDGGIRIACLPGGAATLSVQVRGKAPVAGSRFLVIPATRTGRSRTFTFTAGPDGTVKFARARTDRQLTQMWAAFRGGNNATIRFPDGGFAVQSLVGARATLPARVCG